MLDILMPLNRVSPFLKESLFSISIAQQRLSNELKCDSELILIVNGINDQSIIKIESLAAQIGLDNFRIITSSEDGISRALNKGIKESKAPYIARMDDDDVVMKDRFVRQIQELRSDSNLLLIGTYAKLIDANNNELGELRHPVLYSDIRKFLLFQNCFVHSSVMFRRDVLEEIGLYRPERDGVEDYDLWCRISSQGKVVNLPEYLVKHRIHDQQTSNKSNHHMNLKLRQLFIDNFDVLLKNIKISEKQKMRISNSFLALSLSRRYMSMRSVKRFFALPYLFKSWFLSPRFSTQIVLRILKFKWFSK